LGADPEYDGSQEVSARRLIVIGAGPVGLAAAIEGVQRNWEVTVLEQSEVGASVRNWGPTRFFSPLAMNLPPGAAKIINGRLPPDDALLTGPEFVEGVLMPLASSEALAGCVKIGHRVIAIGRSGLTKCEFARHPIRHERPFRVLVDTPEGERVFESEAVIDASGTYGLPAEIGVGGMPALGERALASRFIRHLGALYDRIERFDGTRILLVGHGHSAANAVLQLAKHETRVIWATRSMNRRPCIETASDSLPERQRVVAEANELATNPPRWLQVERRARVESMSLVDGRCFRVTLGGDREYLVNEIVGLTGYRPDLSLTSELQIEIDPVTEGSARLARALSNVTDCLSVPTVAPENLESGEPGYYLAGAKSYGRARTFLLKTGYAQLETILNRLDYYASD
jgi:thioredoxin reductase